MQDGGGAAQGQGLVGLGGGIDGDGVASLEQLTHLLAQLFAQLVVEVDQRLIEQNQRSILDQRPRHRRALLLATGQFQRVALEQSLDTQHLRRGMDLFQNLSLAHPGLTQG